MLARRLALMVVVGALVGAAVAQDAAVPETPAHKAQIAKDKKELAAYTLTMDVVRRAFVTISAIRDAAKSDPEIAKAIAPKKTNLEPTLDEMAATVGTLPQVVAIVKAHGFTPRELTVAEIALMEASMAAMFVEQGETVEAAVNEGLGNAANIKLMGANKAEITELAKKYPMMDPPSQ